jgi:hypothetical protein
LTQFAWAEEKDYGLAGRVWYCMSKKALALVLVAAAVLLYAKKK